MAAALQKELLCLFHWKFTLPKLFLLNSSLICNQRDEAEGQCVLFRAEKLVAINTGQSQLKPSHLNLGNMLQHSPSRCNAQHCPPSSHPSLCLSSCWWSIASLVEHSDPNTHIPWTSVFAFKTSYSCRTPPSLSLLTASLEAQPLQHYNPLTFFIHFPQRLLSHSHLKQAWKQSQKSTVLINM